MGKVVGLDMNNANAESVRERDRLSSQTSPPLPPEDARLAVVMPAGLQFRVPAGQTIVQAAEVAGVCLPSACRNGTCRACLSRVVTGTVAHQIAWPGLSAEEKEAGYFLPCVALAGTDLVFEQPQASTAAAPP